MPSLSAVRAANALFSPSYGPPVALFLGGTSGIGRAMAQRFAHYTKGNARIIICGRNEEAAKALIATFPKPETAEPAYEFVHCDAVLMKNCQATITNLLARLPVLNFLVMSPGYLTLKGRDETEEGLDKKMALNYYARWKFVHDLMPLLRKAKDAGQDAAVMSILGAGNGGKIDTNDLGLKKTFSVINAMLAVPTYSDLMMEAFAEQQPDIAFTHIYPGIVRTPILNIFTNPLLRPLNTLLYALIYPFSIDASECAEYMLYALFEGKKGAYRRGAKGDDLGRKAYFGTEEQRKLLWEHTVDATKVTTT